jgi:phosphatidylglycerol:prolipoprotein diacylglycerol transferase
MTLIIQSSNQLSVCYKSVYMRPEILNYLNQHDIHIYVPDYKACYIAMTAIALILSTIMAIKRGLPALKFYLPTVLICLMSFLGGRAFFELRNFDHSITYSISDILLGSGTESTGAYIGGIFGAFLFLSWMKIDFLAALDIYAPVLALSLCIGRLGCFMSGCCFGKTTSLPWAVSFPQNSPA